MHPKKLRIPLVKLYFGFVMLIIIITFATSCWFSYRNYEVYLELKESAIQTALVKLSYNFEERLHITEYLMNLFANRINCTENYSIENITHNISHHDDLTDIQGNILAWTFISYVDQDLNLVTSGKTGILSQPINVASKRYKLTEHKHDLSLLNNRNILFDKADRGLISQKFIVPTALALIDKTEQFHGYIVAGIRLKLINRFLTKSKEDFISYAILDEDGDFVTSSNSIDLSSSFLKYLKHSIRTSTQQYNEQSIAKKTVKLSNPLKYGDFIYTHYTRVNNYPFYMVIGEKENYYYGEYKKEVIPQIFRNIIIAIVISGLLLFLSYHVVKPIIDLGIKASKISQGLKVQDNKTYISEEFNTLNNLLMQIQEMASKLRSKQQEVVHANKKLKTANSIIRSNISFMTHELQNPNYSVIGHAKLIAAGKNSLSPSQQDALDTIIQSAEYQTSQINYFLNLFKFQHMGKTVKKEYVDIHYIINCAISMLKSLSLDKNIKVYCEIAAGLPYFYCDSIMFSQMLQNLISNAIKYNKNNGSVLISAYIQTNLNNNFLVISVEDTGDGISDADQQKLFRCFERLEKKHEKAKSVIGYGLGLAYVKKCVLAHNGSIKIIRSTIGKGTKFTLKFII